jgi:hypothetical protein
MVETALFLDLLLGLLADLLTGQMLLSRAANAVRRSIGNPDTHGREPGCKLALRAACLRQAPLSDDT